MTENVCVVTSTDGAIGRIHMDDPTHQNRLTDRLVDELLDALAALAADETVKVVVMTGRPDVFCGGGTREMLLSIVSGHVQVKDAELPVRMVELPVPIIGALEGHAVGGGLAVAMWCDLAIASSGSRYGFNFTSMGFTPGMGVTGLLPLLVGHGFAAEMMMTSKFYKGRELERRGLFTHVVPAGEVVELSLEIARRIASQPRHVTVMLKAELANRRREILSSAMLREHGMHMACFARPDMRSLIESSYFEPAPGSPPSTRPPAETLASLGQANPVRE